MVGEDPTCHVSEKERKYSCALPTLSSLLLDRQPCLTFHLFLLIIMYCISLNYIYTCCYLLIHFFWILLVDFIVQTLRIFRFYTSIFSQHITILLDYNFWLTCFWCYIIILSDIIYN